MTRLLLSAVLVGALVSNAGAQQFQPRTFQFTIPFTLKGLDPAITQIAGVCHVGQLTNGVLNKGMLRQSVPVAAGKEMGGPLYFESRRNVSDILLNEAGARAGEIVVRFDVDVDIGWAKTAGGYECALMGCPQGYYVIGGRDEWPRDCAFLSSNATDSRFKTKVPVATGTNTPLVKGTFTF